MTTYKGKDGVAKIGADIIGEMKSFEVEVSSNEVDTSTMGVDWTGVDSTLLSWKGTMEVFWDPGDAGQVACVQGTKVALELYPQGETTANVVLSGTALITNKGQSQSHDGMVELTIQFTGDGELTEGVVP